MQDNELMLLNKARAFSMAGHAAIGQVRKYTNEPYFVHPEEVVRILQQQGFASPVLAAAYMHDLVEDTKMEIQLIRREFGDYIAGLVWEVTDVSRPEDGNRATRKAIDRRHIAGASYAGKSIKLADLISNTKSIVDHDENFAKTYLPEKRMLLTVLTDGNRKLWEIAAAQVQEAEERLKVEF